uniref:ARAD1C04532p n=1 Tax=Blastobotrys adeninivorans TaxID=409370 RepID=A0A060SZF1_BLAAD
MTSIVPFRATDLLKMGSVNLDVLTENYHLGYYLQYLATWPDMVFQAISPGGKMTGYMIGKSEGRGQEWHSHVTAVTVDYDHRRLGIARQLVRHLEHVSSEDSIGCYFMDLFVRTSNKTAIDMYKRMGFSVFRRVVGYYSSGEPGDDAEDGFDMRMPLKRDSNRQSLVKSAHTEESPHFEYKYDPASLK